MPGRGIDMVLPSDYDKLSCARQGEIIELIVDIENIQQSASLDEAVQLLAVLKSKLNQWRVCYAPGVLR